MNFVINKDRLICRAGGQKGGVRISEHFLKHMLFASVSVGVLVIGLSANKSIAGEVAQQQLAYVPVSKVQQKIVKDYIRPTQIAQVTEDVVQEDGSPTQWNVSAGVLGTYDDWKNDFNAGDSGSVYSSNLNFSLQASDLVQSYDSFSVYLSTAYVKSDVNRGSVTNSTTHMSDTYLTLGYGMPVSGDWSTEVEASFSLPTGLTSASELQRLSTPSTGLTSGSFIGSGFDAGLQVKLIKQIKEKSVYAGGGFKKKGGYDPTSDVVDDNVKGGYEVSGIAGISGIEVLGIPLMVDGSYTRGQGYAGEVSNSVTVSAMSFKNLTDKIEVNGSYFFMYNDSAPNSAPALIRQEQYRKGYMNSAGAGVTYHIDDAWSVRGAVTGSYNNTKMPADSTYFSAGWSLGGEGGVDFQVQDNIALTTSLKYSEEDTNDNTGANTKFTGTTASIGMNVNF